MKDGFRLEVGLDVFVQRRWTSSWFSFFGLLSGLVSLVFLLVKFLGLVSLGFSFSDLPLGLVFLVFIQVQFLWSSSRFSFSGLYTGTVSLIFPQVQFLWSLYRYSFSGLPLGLGLSSLRLDQEKMVSAPRSIKVQDNWR